MGPHPGKIEHRDDADDLVESAWRDGQLRCGARLDMLCDLLGSRIWVQADDITPGGHERTHAAVGQRKDSLNHRTLLDFEHTCCCPHAYDAADFFFADALGAVAADTQRLEQQGG